MPGGDNNPFLAVGGVDPELHEQLDRALIAFNDAATGTSGRGVITVKVTDTDGSLVGGLTASIWAGLCAIDKLWIREDARGHGWGSKILRAAEAEALRRGCDRVAVASFTFQAPAFYQRHGYTVTGRTPGIPGGHEAVFMYKQLSSAPPGPAR